MASTSAGAAAQASRAQLYKGLAAASIGNILEWFDWVIYAMLATTLAGVFFPGDDPTVALLSVLAVFAVGFFFRPLGGIVLSGFTDRYGRKAGMVLTMVFMAGGALLIGVSPSYAQVGLLAPVLLLLARIMQGLSTGGEYAAVTTYLSEIAPNGKRGLYSCLLHLSTAIGVIAATGTALGLRSALSSDELAAWGWRLPFVAGAVVGVAALYLRHRVEETGAFQATKVKETPQRGARPIWLALRRHPMDVFRIFVLSASVGLWYYTFAFYLPVYVAGQGLAKTTALTASMVALAIFILALPLMGWLSDRYGRRLFLKLYSVLVVVGAVPLFAILESTLFSLLVVQVLGLLIFAPYAAIAPAAMAEQFPTEVRTAGLGMAYALAVAIFGGTAPYLLEWLNAHELSAVYPWYLTALGVVTFIAVSSMRDRRTENMQEL